jgi:hypothetical protein
MGAVSSRRCEAVAILLAGLNRGRPGGKSSGMNVHVAWRMALAKRAALDCYWLSPPGGFDRAGPVHMLGGELKALWSYDYDEEEWSEDYRLGELDVTVSNFLVGTIERFIDDVSVAPTPTPSSTCVWPRCNNPVRYSWGDHRVLASTGPVYPDRLTAALIE